MEERMCRGQKLIDACFQLVMTATAREYNKHFQSLSMERKAAWVADQLRELGFDTAPYENGLRKRWSWPLGLQKKV